MIYGMSLPYDDGPAHAANLFAPEDPVAMNAGAGIGTAFTDRRGGSSVGQFCSFNLGHSDEDDLHSLRANMSSLRRKLDISPVQVVKQIHSPTVRTIDRPEDVMAGADGWLGNRLQANPALVQADAMVTTLSNVPLAVRVADCVPVLFADAKAGVIGAAHAGREGLLAGVLEATVHAMKARRATHIQAWIGPHICGSCYEVPEEMAHSACAKVSELACMTRWGTFGLDLGAGAHAILSRMGVLVQRIDPCTMENTRRFFSHRGDHGYTGNQIGVVWRAG